MCRRYTAEQALQMGLCNIVVPHDQLDQEVDKWCRVGYDVADPSISASRTADIGTATIQPKSRRARLDRDDVAAPIRRE